MKNIKEIVFFLILFLMMGCPESGKKYEIWGTVKLINNSKKKVCYLYEYSGWQNFDTLLPNNEVLKKYTVTIEPDSFSYKRMQVFEEIGIDSTHLLMFYFFDPDTLAQMPWERIAKENIILKRVDIHSSKELEDRNFEIIYP